MTDAFAIASPLLRLLDAETAHHATIAALKLLPCRAPPANDPRLAVHAFGLDFPNPIGLAAGFDKNAEVADAMLGFGFGFVEVGTLTPRAQPGNPRPRAFRLIEDRAVINRYGFNNEGHAPALARLSKRARRGIVGVNIGANKDAGDRVAGLCRGRAAPSPTSRAISRSTSVRRIRPACAIFRSRKRFPISSRASSRRATRRRFGGPCSSKSRPISRSNSSTPSCASRAIRRIDGMIVSNTTISRPVTLRSPFGEGERRPLRRAAVRSLDAHARANIFAR